MALPDAESATCPLQMVCVRVLVALAGTGTYIVLDPNAPVAASRTIVPLVAFANVTVFSVPAVPVTLPPMLRLATGVVLVTVNGAVPMATVLVRVFAFTFPA